MKRVLLTFAATLGLWAAAAQQTPESAGTDCPATQPAEVACTAEALPQPTPVYPPARWNKVLERLPRVSGYAQLGYEGGTDVSTFLVKRVRLILAGDLAPKLGYRVQLELLAPRMVDAFIDYRPLRQLKLKAGEFKIPFTIENTDYTPLNMEFIEYPMGLTRLMGLNDLCDMKNTGRDLGAMIYGGFGMKGCDRDVVSYDIAVLNGEGLNVRDANKSKDVVARVMVRPVRGLTLAGYVYRGEYGADCMRRTRYGGGAAYDRGRGVVRGEWIGGRTGSLKSEGWYAMGGVRFDHGLMAALRYDTFIEDRDAASTRRRNYTAGLSWQPLRYFRCQLDYTYEYYAAAGVRDRNVVAVLLTGMF